MHSIYMYNFKIVIAACCIILQLGFIFNKCNDDYCDNKIACIVSHIWTSIVYIVATIVFVVFFFTACGILSDIINELYKFGIMITYVWNYGLHGYFRFILDSNKN